MRIALLIYGSLDTLSGGYYYDRQMVHHLERHGHHVDVVSLPWRSYPVHLTQNLTALRRLGAADRAADLWVLDELCHPSAFWLAGRLKKPRIALVHHLRISEAHPRPLLPLYRAVERTFLRRADGFIFNSQVTRDVVADLRGDLPRHVVAWPAADRFRDDLSPAFIRERAFAPGPLRVLFIGNLIPRKNLSLLLQALPAEATLDVVGDEEMDLAYARAMRQLAARHGERVRFHGRLGTDALAGLLRQAHVLCVPSQYEGFGIVYLEGMAFGLPALGSARGGARDLIRDGENGWLLDPEDANALRQHLQTLHADRALLAAMGLAALERYRQHPTWEESMAAIRRFLETFP